MSGGAFNDAARAAIYRAGDDRCIGCGRSDLSAQHRRARGMGGTSDVTIGHPANGVPLCGDGVRGCHGWTEANPEWAALLGWRLVPGEPSLGTPFWTRFGWRKWIEDPVDATPLVAYVDEVEDLDRVPERLRAVETFRVVQTRQETTMRKRLGWTEGKSTR